MPVHGNQGLFINSQYTQAYINAKWITVTQALWLIYYVPKFFGVFLSECFPVVVAKRRKEKLESNLEGRTLLNPAGRANDAITEQDLVEIIKIISTLHRYWGIIFEWTSQRGIAAHFSHSWKVLNADGSLVCCWCWISERDILSVPVWPNVPGRSYQLLQRVCLHASAFGYSVRSWHR